MIKLKAITKNNNLIRLYVVSVFPVIRMPEKKLLLAIVGVACLLAFSSSITSYVSAYSSSHIDKSSAAKSASGSPNFGTGFTAFSVPRPTQKYRLGRPDANGTEFDNQSIPYPNGTISLYVPSLTLLTSQSNKSKDPLTPCTASAYATPNVGRI